MRSLASLHENRAYGPQNFWPPVQNDFCNKIGTTRKFEDIRALSVIEVPAQGSTFVEQTAVKMDSSSYSLRSTAIRDRLLKPSGDALFKQGCAEIPVHHIGHWWPPSAGQIDQVTVIFFAVPISRFTLPN